MEETTYQVGGEVEKFCTVCQKDLVHIIKTVTKLGKVSRVTCSKCGTGGIFRSSAILSKLKNLSTKTSESYDRSRTYRSGQFMNHPTFGQGEIITVLDTKKIDVLFIDKMRRLIHSQS